MQRDSIRYFYRSASLSFLIRIAGAGALFGANVLLARSITPAAFGTYAYAVEIVAMTAVVGTLGLDQIAIRVVPDALVASDRQTLLRFMATGTIFAVLICGLLAVGLLLGKRAGALPAGFEPGVAILTAGLALALSLLRLLQETLRGSRKIAQSQLGEQLAWPLALMLLAGITLVSGMILRAGAIILFQCLVYAAVIAWLAATVRELVPSSSSKPGAGSDGWLAVSTPLAASALLSVFLNRGDILALGLVVSPAMLAPYTAASRLAALMVLGQAAASAVSAALLREAWVSNDKAALQSAVDRAAGVSVLFALPLVLVFVSAPSLLLGLFGPAYLAGTTALRILALAQLINALTGPVALLVVVCDLQRAYAVAMALCGLVMTALLVALTPRYGLIGAAVSTLVALGALNVALAILIQRRIGVRAWATPRAIAATLGDFRPIMARLGWGRS